MIRSTLLTISTIATLASPAWAQDAGSGDAARGQHLFITVGCSQCHGTVGQGGVGPRLAPGPIPASVIALYIRNPANVMPPYIQAVLGDTEVGDIHAYLASIKPAPKLQDIPLLTSAYPGSRG
jgi:mono/diheme cytochrome c family protein